ncbi:SURF1 family cytochrome oxidase biogenesis protein [Nocardioides sp. URHA0020]|uniref:SURF1 family cytochrome oxidase biogenesis protein n=1 Tax=Nocardioides sp. URHA0020 TaxID=1380392 RepID=UPI0009DDA4A0|nr:SURF1 family protein [Nocardioides sp. URHA0020]
MRSWGFLISRRWLLFAVVVVLLCYAAWWLGQWQFHRLDDRKASNAIVRANEDRAPTPVADVLAPGRVVDEDDEWRQVTATGTYDPDETVIVRYRTRDGASGIDVVVPLVTADGSTLLVDRGWMAADNEGASPADVPAPPTGEVTVDGWVRADADGDSTVVSDHSTRSISSVQIGEAIGQEVYGGFIELDTEDGRPAATLLPVELPELNNGPHFFYGLQWWFFGLLALFGFGYLAWDEWRSQRRDEPSAREGALTERRAKRAAKNSRKQAVKAAYQKAYADERAARDAHRARSMPPSTGSITPDTNDAAGESTKAATRPNSAGSP